MVVVILLCVENQVMTKHVESLLVPRLDEGSTPSSSTTHNRRRLPLVACDFLYARVLFYFQDCAQDLAGAAQLLIVEVVSDKHTMLVNHHCPRITQIGTATIVTNDEFLCCGIVGSLGIQDACAYAIWGMAVAIGEQHPVVGQAQRMERMSLEPHALQREGGTAVA